MSAEKELTLWDHLRELRDRLVRIAIALIITTLVSFIFTDYFFKLLIAPMNKNQEKVTLLVCKGEGESRVCEERTDIVGLGGDKPISTRPTGMFINYMKIAFIGGLALAMPVILYEFIRYVTPGLYPNERRYLYFIVPMGTISFMVGLAFCYFVMLPAGIPFLLQFGRHIATPLWDIGEYISIVTTLLVAMGLMFELPLVVFILARLGVVNYRMLIRQWKVALLLCAVASAVITPTGDPYNMMLVAFPLMGLYLLSVFFALLARPRLQPAPASSTPTASEG